jgi:hypothetical protein
MRFDAKRAAEWSGRFWVPRAAGTEDERRAAQVVADALESSGLRVEQRAVPGSRPGRVLTTNVIGRRELEPPPPVRVVFQTSLDEFDSTRTYLPAWIARRRTRERERGPSVADNCTGLALLLELARTWPPGTRPRMETCFVAAGGRALGGVGVHDLVAAIAHEWPHRPTLVIGWLAPGIGPGLALTEQGTGQLAETAAQDLWIPHQRLGGRRLRRELWPASRHGPAFVGMIGDAVATGRSDIVAQVVDVDALGRAAQFATEVALRWAKEQPSGV